MTRLNSRLNRLESQHRAAAPEPHALCKLLFQARVISSGKRESWELDAELPERRPTDGNLYPVFECFYGSADDCPQKGWADSSYARDRHLHALRNLTDEDLLEVGGEPPSEVLERQREDVERYRERANADLPKLERRLHKMKEGTQHA